MMTRQGLLLVLTLSFSLSGFSKSISVMTYNLENLFDTEHDEGKEDYTYLPKKIKDASKVIQAHCRSLSNPYYRRTCFNLDWSERVLEAKISNISKVIRLHSKNRVQGPDILVMQEVENKNVLAILAKNLNYKYLSLLEGEDSRGIDVAVLSQYPIVSEKIHNFSLKPYSSRKTRPILEVDIKVGSKIVSVFANHWPSQGNVDQTRLIASEVLKNKALKSKADLVIATGDFNTSSDDKVNGIRRNILPHFVDVETIGRQRGQAPVKGTHWYRGVWESLDRIFVRKDDKEFIDYSSFEIVYHPFMLKEHTLDMPNEDEDENQLLKPIKENIPNRFDPVNLTGFSDHLPVVIHFNL